MMFAWLEQLHDKVFASPIPLHFKQYGDPRNNPAVQHYMAQASS